MLHAARMSEESYLVSGKSAMLVACRRMHLHSPSSSRRQDDTSHMSLRGRTALGGARCSAELASGQGSPRAGASRSTGHQAMCASSAQNRLASTCAASAAMCQMLDGMSCWRCKTLISLRSSVPQPAADRW